MPKMPARVVSTDELAVNVFTDGSSFSNPRRGGIGYRFVTIDPETGQESWIDSNAQGYEQGTNQQMELMACVLALRELGGRRSPLDVSAFARVIVHTDSTYVAQNIERARKYWRRDGWMTRDGNPVENAELWKMLVKAEAQLSPLPKYRWGKGHSKTNPHNKAVDALAKASARGPLLPPLAISSVRRKTTANKTELGSIRPEGQRIKLRIISTRFLRVQRIHLYKCQVVSSDDPYVDCVDNLYSDDVDLRAGHVYDVRLNDEPDRPRIVECYGEVNAE